MVEQKQTPPPKTSRAKKSKSPGSPAKAKAERIPLEDAGLRRSLSLNTVVVDRAEIRQRVDMPNAVAVSLYTDIPTDDDKVVGVEVFRFMTSTAHLRRLAEIINVSIAHSESDPKDVS